MFQELNCKGYCLTSLLQYQIYYPQCVGKSKTIFDLPLNNHRKDSKVKKNSFQTASTTKHLSIYSNKAQNLCLWKKRSVRKEDQL